MRNFDKTSATMQVVEYIKRGVAEGRWTVGDKLPTEKELSETFELSRASVHTAIQQLVITGMVRSVRGSGSYVCSTQMSLPLDNMQSAMISNHSDLISMIEFRRIIEMAAVELAAQRATSEDVYALQHTNEQLQNAKTLDEIVEHDMMFHSLIVKATRNFAIIRVFEIMEDSYLCLLEKNVAIRGSDCIKEHMSITTAIATRSCDMARKCMAEHLDRSAARYFQQNTVKESEMSPEPEMGFTRSFGDSL